MRWYWNTYWGALKFGVRSGWNTFRFVVQHEHAHRRMDRIMNLAIDARINAILKDQAEQR